MITLIDLIASLEETLEVYGNLDIILSSDGEGNNYSPASGYGLGQYEPESTWAGYVTFEDDEDFEKANCIVIWPVN